MTDLCIAGTFSLGDCIVNRLGYGATQFAGPAPATSTVGPSPIS
jgi:hypothetical protein